MFDKRSRKERFMGESGYRCGVEGWDGVCFCILGERVVCVVRYWGKYDIVWPSVTECLQFTVGECLGVVVWEVYSTADTRRSECEALQILACHRFTVRR